jgi:hypothetical protein
MSDSVLCQVICITKEQRGLRGKEGRKSVGASGQTPKLVLVVLQSISGGAHPLQTVRTFLAIWAFDAKSAHELPQ